MHTHRYLDICSLNLRGRWQCEAFVPSHSLTSANESDGQSFPLPPSINQATTCIFTAYLTAGFTLVTL